MKVKVELEKIKKRNFIFLLLAGIINAFGVMFFLYPVKLYDSGISGLSMFFDRITPAYLTMSIFLIAINIPIFIIDNSIMCRVISYY